METFPRILLCGALILGAAAVAVPADETQPATPATTTAPAAAVTPAPAVPTAPVAPQAVTPSPAPAQPATPIAPPDKPLPAALPAMAPATPVLTPRLSEVLGLIDRETQFPLKDAVVEDKMIEAVLSVVGCGARLAPKTAPAGTADHAAIEKAVVLRSGCMYLALNRMETDAAPAIAGTLAEAKPDTFEGLILDLRYVEGGTAADAQTAVAALDKLEKPLVLLVSGQTAGAGEIFAVLARKSAAAVLIGQPTRGCQSSLEAFPLANGEVVLLPKPVAEVAGVKMPGAPLPPDVAVDGLPAREQLSGLTAERFEALPDRDPALRQAVDLLTTIRAFGKKHF